MVTAPSSKPAACSALVAASCGWFAISGIAICCGAEGHDDADVLLAADLGAGTRFGPDHRALVDVVGVLLDLDRHEVPLVEGGRRRVVGRTDDVRHLHRGRDRRLARLQVRDEEDRGHDHRGGEDDADPDPRDRGSVLRALRPVLGGVVVELAERDRGVRGGPRVDAEEHRGGVRCLLLLELPRGRRDLAGRGCSRSERNSAAFWYRRVRSFTRACSVTASSAGDTAGSRDDGGDRLLADVLVGDGDGRVTDERRPAVR